MSQNDFSNLVGLLPWFTTTRDHDLGNRLGNVKDGIERDVSCCVIGREVRVGENLDEPALIIDRVGFPGSLETQRAEFVHVLELPALNANRVSSLLMSLSRHALPLVLELWNFSSFFCSRRAKFDLHHLQDRIRDLLRIYTLERSACRKTVPLEFRLFECFLDAVFPGVELLAHVRRDPVGTRRVPSHLDKFSELLLKSCGRRMIFLRFSDELSFVVCDGNVVEMDLSDDSRHRWVLRNADFVECGDHWAAAIVV